MMMDQEDAMKNAVKGMKDMDSTIKRLKTKRKDLSKKDG